jgi:hypothetical protein
MDEKTEEHKENPLFQLDVVLAFLYQRIGLIFPIRTGNQSCFGRNKGQ